MKQLLLAPKTISLRVKILLPLIVLSSLAGFYDLNLSAVLVAFSFIAYYFVKLAILRPIQLLQKAIARRGEQQDIRSIVTPGRDEIEEIAETIYNVLDQLSDSEEKFRQLAENIKAVFWMATPDRKKALYVSPLFEELWGRNVDELYKDPDSWFDSIVPEDYEFVFESYRNIKEKHFDIEYRIRRPSGETIWVHDRGYPVKNEHGHIIRIAGMLTNISKRKAAEDALKNTELRNRQLISELEVANSKALHAARAKGDFLANMSHEIRTPMNGVIGPLELLAGTELNEEQREYVTTASKSAEFLLEVINDVLDFSKLEAGKMTIQSSIINLMVVVEDVVEMLSFKAEEKGIELALRYAPSCPVMVIGDPARIKQILVNLIGNAVKFTERGHVFVNVECKEQTEKGGVFSIAIEDTGIGIPPDKINSIFETFTQVDSSTSRRYGGTGLGLTICKQIAGLMGGEIFVESRLGSGSTFSFNVTFPVASKVHGLEEANSLKGVHFAVVDDNECNQRIIHELITSRGNRCEIFSSGQQALGAILRAWESGDPIHMVLVDQKLPLMEGESLGRKIKSDSRMSQTELILMTALGAATNIQQIKSSGFSGHINKPVRSSQLLKSLGQLWAKRSSLEVSMDSVPKPTSPSSSVNSGPAVVKQILDVDVLLVDDNVTNREVARRMLEKFGCRVDMATNGREAVDKVRRFPYSLVFMDCQMPEMDGYQATHEVRVFEKGRNWHIPVVAMTAHALEGDREKCTEAGMDDYISKPVKQENLFNMVKKWTSKIDGAVLSSLMSLDDGSSSFFITMVNEYLENANKVLGDLSSAIKNLERDRIRTVAHGLRGASATIGATRLFSLCSWIELIEGDVIQPDMEKLLKTLEIELVSTRTLLENFSRQENSLDAAA